MKITFPALLPVTANTCTNPHNRCTCVLLSAVKGIRINHLSPRYSHGYLWCYSNQVISFFIVIRLIPGVCLSLVLISQVSAGSHVHSKFTFLMELELWVTYPGQEAPCHLQKLSSPFGNSTPKNSSQGHPPAEPAPAQPQRQQCSQQGAEPCSAGTQLSGFGTGELPLLLLCVKQQLSP